MAIMSSSGGGCHCRCRCINNTSEVMALEKRAVKLEETCELLMCAFQRLYKDGVVPDYLIDEFYKIDFERKIK